MQLKNVAIPAFVLLMVALMAGRGLAQGRVQLKSVVEVEQEGFNPQGEKIIRRVPAAGVVPGQEVIFTTTYENTGSQDAENAVITNPLPEHMLYQTGSARGAGTLITFSVDGGQTYHSPAKLIIRDAAGREYPARPRDYTHIRWTFEKPLPPGAKGEVSFRAILK
jgi:uncharacterized repeat protein (TIGR01451 family)